MNETRVNETSTRETETSVVRIPCGRLCGYCCGDCIHMDNYYVNNYGEAWCGIYEKYYSPSADASTCSYYEAKAGVY